jgi:hypothetical protein
MKSQIIKNFFNSKKIYLFLLIILMKSQITFSQNLKLMNIYQKNKEIYK